ncbi:MAG: type II toxin-antitoxin system prevent-host-death family antitoxin [Verrucomicrobia bacterium]|nr:type II toxin-antitoxin system prevent-host-death family antitoxin [Verrucomicrobiota bacterium]
MKTLNIHEAKTKLSAVLAEIEQTGEVYLICRNGKPIADLVPHQRPDRLKTHPMVRDVRIKYDPTEPATEDEWPEEYR